MKGIFSALVKMLKKRFQAIDFEVIEIDGHNFDQIDKALATAKKESTQPVLIIAKQQLLKVLLLWKEATMHTCLGNDEIAASKVKAGFNPEKVSVSADVKGAFDKLIVGSTAQNAWAESLSAETKAKIAELQNPNFDQLNIQLLKLIHQLQQEIQTIKF